MDTVNKEYLKKLTKASIIRAVRSFCQVFGAMITVGAAISEIDWLNALSVSIVASVYSILTSFAKGLPEVDIEKDNEKKGGNQS